MATLPCPPELWPEFSALLDQALDLNESQRRRWLAGLGSEYAAALPWLFKVLTTAESLGDSRFMLAPPLGLSDSGFVAGQQVGTYALEQRLGGGGMGEVWLASRIDGTLKRQVALKLPHSELFAGVQRHRFERERDILATLSHPNIAQLYDAGVSESLHPYLAMEWVNGVSITRHCSDGKLSLERRLDLFLQILEAVGYAHARLIAHRDIKPSNILVTGHEQVKLLDFGIAKLLSTDPQTGLSDLTQVHGCAATPGYAAPEQLAGKPITVAVDLYALGVVLHELLTGQRPPHLPGKGPGQADSWRASSRIEAGFADQVGGLDARRLRKQSLATSMRLSPKRSSPSRPIATQAPRHSRATSG